MKVYTVLYLLIAAILTEFFASADDYHPKLQDISTRILRKNDGEDTTQYWIQNAQTTLKAITEEKQITTTAKNVILFLGDGMSVPTIAASRVYLNGENKEENSNSFEKFPYTALSKTYCVDRQVADSACSATAYLCGVKANEATMGVNAKVDRGNCLAQNNTDNHVLSIAQWSQQQGKSAGIVTTARVTHASPGGVYAHIADRDWECDSDIPSSADQEKCPDIAIQLIQTDLQVILGGGRAKLFPKDQTDEENHSGSRSDGRDLIKEWLEAKNKSNTAQYIWSRDELLNLDVNNTDMVMGLFNSDHINYYLDRTNETTEPTLEEMTEKAIQMLRKNENGYFLFVEGGRIDMAHHEGKANKALAETSEFSKAIQRAVDMTDETDTLIVVTADHAHTMSYAGYALRGNDINGYGGTDNDGLPYSTLSYANGPGYKPNNADGSRYDISKDDSSNKDYTFPGTSPIGSETHGGDDVAIFARGPFAHLFRGVMEQNVIPHIMAYASCVGNGTLNPNCP